ncbi:mono/diheme cytochrome c family protein [Larkinella arboricola]|uniref:Mono/diheme cytochrome c family protein n=2 Tax=Larkinella arboricola TaxID=643671 RepID=A0A327X3W2_LARAB|nr:mono/diheme cytochrome c family protein [Larkinella arboricola]
MLMKILKWSGIILGSILLLLIVFYTVVYFQTESRANKLYDVKLQSLTIPNDSASYALGKHIAGIRGCLECHGNDLSGNVFLDESTPLGLLYASNLTRGKGGISYTDQDWIRALRHGLGKDNKSLWFMPSPEVSTPLSNQDMGALIYFLKSQPPVDKTHPAKELKPLGRLLTFLGEFPLFPAEAIDHDAKPVDHIPAAIDPVYGKYLAVTCSGCHGANFKGGPGHSPGEPRIADLTQTGNVGKWNSHDFITAMRTGKTPDGRVLSDFMPWKYLATTYTDDELKAIHLYLHDLK